MPANPNNQDPKGVPEQTLAPHEICPEGTKVWMLCLGWLEADDAFLVRGANISLKSTEGESFVNKRRKLPMYCVLIEHPTAGLILWETGGDKDWPRTCGEHINDVFPRVEYGEEHDLANAIASTGHNIKDVKHVILGHLHLDHAGGLGWFKGTNTQIWCQELELKAAFMCVATGMDDAVYLKHYLDLDLNWKVVDERKVDFCQGITLHHFPGHTEGLMGMQINLPQSGTWLFTSDQYHVGEGFRDGITQGYLARDHHAWFTSHNRIKRIEARFAARVIVGHDAPMCQAVWDEQQGKPLQ